MCRSNGVPIAFSTLKEKLMSAPVLTYPSPDPRHIDASNSGFGAVLSQEIDCGIAYV